jgi:hypothetical protein
MNRLLLGALVLLSCARPRYVAPSLIPKEALALSSRSLERSEEDVLAKQGLVVLSKGTSPSFHVGYTALFHDNQPVFITADSILHAWHSSYDALLMQVEFEGLVPALTKLLTELRDELAKHAKEPGAADLDLYLTVAHSLLNGTAAEPVAGANAEDVKKIVAQCEFAAGAGSLELFGNHDDFDFSMLKPRGHYTQSIQLQRYFRAMSFLGRVELRLARRPALDKPWVIDRRTLRATALLHSVFTPATRKGWQDLDSTLASFVGPPDSMSLPGLEKGLSALGPVDRASDAAIVAAFHGTAQQRIRSQLQYLDDGAIAFVLLGQRFVYDSQVTSHLVYGTLQTDPVRLMPSPLDVAYAVLHHPQALELLEPEVKRYGPTYAAALDAEWKATDAEDPKLWSGSIYHGWLAALRELSPDQQRDATLPTPLNSKAWGLRILNGQLASWAELRHDNLLYAKQSFTMMLGCEFPFGYVDPYPRFYRSMEALAAHTTTAVEGLPYASAGKTRMMTWLTQMRATMRRLEAIAERERANTPLLAEDLEFFNHMVSLTGKSAVCTTVTEPEGWFADLYYDRSKALWHEPVIADVHTQPTDENGTMVGKVLHVGTSRPRMMVVTLQHDAGQHAQTYRGFVSTYAELETQNFERLTDEAWRERLGKGTAPPLPWLTPILSP